MSDKPKRPDDKPETENPVPPPVPPKDNKPKKKEVGGRKGPEPTRFGDWERKGICVDF